MNRINKIEDSIQEVCEVVSDVLSVDVTVVDAKLKRIAATGKYVKDIGSTLPDGCYYSRLLTGKYSDIDRISSSYEKCLNCKSTEDCEELESLAYPIISANGDLLGVMGLVAFEDEERKYIKYNYKIVEPFLKQICFLLAANFGYVSATSNIKLKEEEFLTLINSLPYGLLCADKDLGIYAANDLALKMLYTPHNKLLKMKLADLFYKFNPRYIKRNNSFTSYSVNDPDKKEIYINVLESKVDDFNKSYILELNKLINSQVKDSDNIINIDRLDNNKNLKELTEDFEKQILIDHIKKYGDTTSSKEIIAEKLGINLSTFYRKLYKYKI